MARFPIGLIAVSVLSSVMTVLAAICCVLWMPTIDQLEALSSHAAPDVKSLLPQSWLRTRAGWQVLFLPARGDGTGIQVASLGLLEKPGSQFGIINGSFDPPRSACSCWAGWPCKALYGARLEAPTHTQLLWAMEAPSWLKPYSSMVGFVDFRRFIPLRPLWRGVIVNTLCYICAVVLVIAIVRYYKMRRRRLTGRCMNCAYPWGACERCSECGARQRNKWGSVWLSLYF